VSPFPLRLTSPSLLPFGLAHAHARALMLTLTLTIALTIALFLLLVLALTLALALALTLPETCVPSLLPPTPHDSAVHHQRKEARL
jgi:hypothetical protein